MAAYSPPIRRPSPSIPIPGEPGVGDHWTPNRKFELLRRIRAGEISFDRACQQYDLSEEELTGWMTREERFGTRGLSVTKIQAVRL